MLYVVRCLSALCLFAFLAKANTWMDGTSNLVLVTGYRLLLLASPVLIAFLGQHAAAAAFGMGGLGCILWLNGCTLAAAFSIALGLSVGGFLIKTQAAETPKGAALNKIALNIGSLLAGGCVAALPDSRPLFLLGGGGICLICVLTCRPPRSSGSAASPSVHRIGPASGMMTQMAWAVLGVAVGIKLVGVFTVLPQLLLFAGNGTSLPSWYGWLISLNSLVVIVLQVPIMRRMEKKQLTVALAPLLGGMFVLAMPDLFCVSALAGAFLWTFLLSLIECAVSYLDALAAADRALLAKEASVGVGAGLTVLAARFFPGLAGAHMIATLGALCVLVGFLLTRSQSAAASLSPSSSEPCSACGLPQPCLACKQTN